MAHKRCRKCNAPLSSDTPTCPYCGARRRSRALWVGLLLLTLGVLAGASFYVDNRNGGMSQQTQKHASFIPLALPELDAPKALPDQPLKSPLPPTSMPGEHESHVLRQPPESAPAVSRLYVEARILNLREGPGTDAPIITKLVHNQELNEVSRRDEWLEVRVPSTGMDGWVHSAYVRPARP